MKNKIILTLLLFASIMQAQEEKKSYTFSLDQAITHATTNNRSAINANRDIEMAKKKKWETTASGLPQINGSISYQNNFEIQKSLIPAEIFGGTPGTFQEVAFGTKHNATGNLSLTQLLFDGSYIVALQASKTYLQFYENSKKKTDIDVREMIINAYGSVLLADESVQILQKNKTVLEKTLFDTDQTFKNGLIEEENVEQLKITLASVNNNLNYVTRLKDISLKMLKVNLGIEIEDELTLTDKLDDLTQKNLDLALKSTDFNATSNINYVITQNFVEQRNLEMKLEKSKALPSLSAGVNFGYNSFGDKFTFFNSDQKYFNYSNLGITLNVPIFSSFARSARTQQAQIALEKAKTDLTETEQKLKLAYQNAKSDYEYSIEQYNSSKESLGLAERIENKQQIKFKEGLSSSFDFTEAQRQLYTSQQNYLQAMVDVINKKAALEKIIGNQ
ncbi:TolC family protein [Flavobacterium aquatile]|uniref:Transporter n=1 Tax=Flavobacterium aquatile LMG 4008 = ATCC 11947 TaxID=1453498 RepID=A0A095UXC3_9FLAO|nr:TolC family protein [Flavobacterium aquatile]KGD67210.1 transporter [Flavobacterium aquatile LMG 4008 = ATCC 11947]OXA66638.1 transporter [Flavobacterium aquatile] [Flavobacterium aquatile LMG 4008 = ATCC 11947]GEC78619.1 transporter [Flavobacterium aquatile]